MRHGLIAGIAACVALASSGASAAARKPAPPASFKASGSLVVGHPGNVGNGNNITRQQFVENCAIPASQGTDGYVIELPKRVEAVTSYVTLTGTSVGGLHDLDVDFFNRDCVPWGSIRTPERHETGTMMAGTRYVFVTGFVGARIDFDFTATSAGR